MGPVTTGCWKQPTKSRAPPTSGLRACTTRGPLEHRPLDFLCHTASVADLTCSCQSEIHSLGQFGAFSPATRKTEKPYQCTHNKAGRGESSHFRFGTDPVCCARNTARVRVLRGFDEQEAPNY